jgi:UTP:GlnB (protein PII) uridylyltransferase
MTAPARLEPDESGFPTSTDESGAHALPQLALERFVQSMPHRYRARFGDDERREHAAIVAERGPRVAHVAAWWRAKGETPWLCFVSDDRPGLLSCIGATLLVHQLDVVEADVYTRSAPSGRSEAVDFFRVRPIASRADDPLVGARELEAMRQVVTALLVGTLDFHDVLARAEARRRAREASRVKVEIDESESGTWLHVEAPDRPGLLVTITRAIFEQGIRIVQSDVRTTPDGRAVDRFELRDVAGRSLAEWLQPLVAATVRATVQRFELRGGTLSASELDG